MRSFLTCTANELRKLFWRPTLYIFIGVVMLYTGLNITTLWLLDQTKIQTSENSYELYHCIESTDGFIKDLKTGKYDIGEPMCGELITLLERFSADMSAYTDEVPENPADWRGEAFLNFYNRLGWLFGREDCYYGYSLNSEIAQMSLKSIPIPDPAEAIPELPAAGIIQAYIEEYDAIFPLISANDWREYVKLYAQISQNHLDSGAADHYSTQQMASMAKLMEEVINLRLKHDIPPAPAVFGHHYGDDWRNEQLSIYFDASNRLTLSAEWYNMQERSDLETQARQALESIEKNNKPLSQRLAVYAYGNIQSALWVICVAMAVLAGGIVAREHKTGTIKLLLTQPHRRRNIFLGKTAALLLTGALMVAAAMITATLTVICFEGPGILDAAVQYSFNGIQHSLPLFMYMAQGIVLALPNLLMCTLLALMLSVLLRSNALSIVFSLLCWFGSSLAQTILMVISERLHLTWLRFLPFLNGNWTIYRADTLSESLLGGTNISFILPGQTFLFSVLVTVATVVVLFYTAYDSFTRRDIK